MPSNATSGGDAPERLETLKRSRRRDGEDDVDLDALAEKLRREADSFLARHGRAYADTDA